MKRFRFIIKRLLSMIVIMFLVSFLVFVVLRMSDADPLTVMIGNNQSTPELRQALTEKYHLDDPVHIQYLRWIKGVLSGDFGTDYVDGQDVKGLIMSRLPITFGLVIMSSVIGSVIAVIMGVAAALRKGKPSDAAISGLMLVLSGAPSFLVSILILIFMTKYNHYKRVMEDTNDGVEIEKSNMLMIGPTGSGKTYLVKTLARLLDVPLAITDATSLTEAGYIGDDIESVVSKLLAAADNDVERAEHGIIFIDEIDKIAKKRNANQRDVSGESVQQGMLKLLEGAEIEVPVGASSKNAMVPMTTVDTKNILFICGGAFPELEEVIKERLNKEASIGFKADLKDKYDKEENLLCKVTVEDVRKFGMIPEFLGRLPILFSLEALTEDMLVRILTEPKNAIVRQYKKLLAMDEVDLEFTEDALHAIAKQAKEKKVGARALRAIIEEFMLDIMYEIPKDDNIGKVTITEDYVEKKGGPLIEMRGVAALPEQEANA